jgi:hypothetical protein
MFSKPKLTARSEGTTGRAVQALVAPSATLAEASVKNRRRVTERAIDFCMISGPQDVK